MSDTPNAIDVQNAVKRYGSFTALKQISLSIHDNEFFTLLGPSGCGKTTLLRMIAGFEDVTEGEIFLYGEEIENLPPHQRPVNTVFQNYALFPHLTILDNVASGLRCAGRQNRMRAKVPVRCWNWCNSANFLPANRHSSLAVSSSAWRWPVRWRHVQRFCFWTSRCRRWI